jgi:hypothetical protein
MKLSVFTNAKAHPRTKAEKQSGSIAVSSPNLPEHRTFANDEELIALVTSFAWSPFTFSGVRHADNFVSTDLLVYDIDEGLTIDAAEAIIRSKSLCALCLPSPSHREDAHRFRLILPLSHTIYNPEQYAATWKVGADLFGTVDEQCKDLARFFFASTMSDGFWIEGQLFEPTLMKMATPQPQNRANPMKGHNKLVDVSGDFQDIVKSIYGVPRDSVPESVMFFLKNAETGIDGGWICALNTFCFSLSLSGIESDVILQLCEDLAPDVLDKRDLDQIRRGIRDGLRRRVEEEL